MPEQFVMEGFSIERDAELPSTLIHFEVVAAIRVPDGFAMPPRQHIVLLRNPGKPESRAYSTHHCAYQEGWRGVPDGPWVLHDGRYDMPILRAYKNMLGRATQYFGD